MWKLWRSLFWGQLGIYQKNLSKRFFFGHNYYNFSKIKRSIEFKLLATTISPLGLTYLTSKCPKGGIKMDQCYQDV